MHNRNKNIATSIEDLNTPPIREKYTPEEAKQRHKNTKNTKKSHKKVKLSPRPIMAQGKAEWANYWLSDVSLHQQIDAQQLREQQHAVEQQVEQKADLNSLHDARLNLLNDQSAQMAYATALTTELKDTEYDYAYTRTWVKDLREALGLIEGEKERFYLSKQALEILRRSEGQVRGDENPVSLDALHLGFYIDEETENGESKYILKFSEAFRAHQLKHPEYHAELRLDPFEKGSKSNQDFWSVAKRNVDGRGITSSDFFRSDALDSERKKITQDYLEKIKIRGTYAVLLKNFNDKGIELNSEQAAFLQRHYLDVKKACKEARADNVFSPMLNGLSLITNEATDEASKQHVKDFIDILIKLSKRKYKNCFFNCQGNFLDCFMVFLVNLSDGTEFNHAAHMQNLKRLTELSDEEFSLFTLFSNRDIPYEGEASSADGLGTFGGVGYTRVPPNYHPNFLETSRGVFYVIDFFKSRNIQFPTDLKKIGNLSKFKGFIRLKGIIDCISLSADGQLQAQIMAKIPKDISIATSCLRAGYCLVHEGMYFRPDDRRFDVNFEEAFPNKPLSSRWFIKPEDLRSLVYSNNWGDISGSNLPNDWFCKAIYLRYLAANCNPENFVKGLAFWDELMDEGKNKKKFYRNGELLESHWETLKKFALKLPTRLSQQVAVEQEEKYIPQSHLRLQLEVEEKSLRKECQYDQKDLEKLDIVDADIIADVRLLNQFSIQYSSEKLPEEELREKLQKVRASIRQADTAEAEHAAILDALALIREAHFRMKKQWLRLEQVYVILLELRAPHLFQIDTSEGKTLIIGIIAILQALQGEKIDVITHDERSAREGYETLQALASLLDVSLCKKTDEVLNCINADILYIDVASAVINSQSAHFIERKNEDELYLGDRKASIAKIDEVDNVVIDINSSTTMRFAENTSNDDYASATLEIFLNVLNQAVVDLLNKGKILSIEEQRAFIKTRLCGLIYYYEHCVEDGKTLDVWIRAAFKRAHPVFGLKLNQDYVIEKENPSLPHSPEVVRIIHKETTGRVDKISHWGAGVHQCVAAWEKKHGNLKVKIPALSEVLAEGNVTDYLQSNYRSRSGFSGTLGTKATQEVIKDVLQVQATTLIMPRAKRREPVNAAWPRVVTAENKGEPNPQYNRSYHFVRPLCENYQDHCMTMLEGIKSAQEKRYSIMIFFNTIDECEQFSKFLRENQVADKHIQILDDTNPPDEDHPEEKIQLRTQTFRPSETVVKLRAKEPKMITLTTAAGSRNTDFQGIPFCFLAKPGLTRVKIQKKGRVGRNGELGISYEIYCKNDLQGAASIEAYEERQEQAMISRLNKKKALRKYKKEVQEEFLLSREAHAEDKEALNAAWKNFFPRIDLHWQANASDEDNLSAMKVLYKKRFIEKLKSMKHDKDSNASGLGLGLPAPQLKAPGTPFESKFELKDVYDPTIVRVEAAGHHHTPKNLFIFNAHNEPQPPNVTEDCLEELKIDGYDTLCLEGVPPELVVTEEFIEFQINEFNNIKIRIENELHASYTKLHQYNVSRLSRIYELHNLSLAGISFHQMLTADGMLNYWYMVKTAFKMGFKIQGIDYQIERLDVQDALYDFSLREARQFNTIMELNKQGRSCVSLLGIMHLPGMCERFKVLPREQQNNTLMVYPHSDKILNDDLLKKSWFEKIFHNNSAHHIEGSALTIHSCDVTRKNAKQAFVQWLKTRIAGNESVDISSVKSAQEEEVIWFKKWLSAIKNFFTSLFDGGKKKEPSFIKFPRASSSGVILMRMPDHGSVPAAKPDSSAKNRVGEFPENQTSTKVQMKRDVTPLVFTRKSRS